MATNTLTTTTAQSPAVSDRSLFSGLRRAMHRRQEQARIRDELHMMSNRELADLGLVPSDINDVATGRYRRD